MQPSDSASEINILKGTLRMRGFSLESWATANGYKPVTVRAIVARHWGRTDTTVKGLLTHEILTKLREFIESMPQKAVNGD